MKVLIADDDPQILRALRVTLRAHGYQVVTAADGTGAIHAAAAEHPDLLMVDLGMPGMTGMDVITAVRGWSSAPILVVSGRTDSADKVEALDAGADDFVTKPFAVDELLARIRALTRRAAAPGAREDAADAVVSFADVTVDLGARTVVRTSAVGTEQIRLTPTEWRFLELLLRHEGRLVTRQQLLRDIWGSEPATDTGYLRLYLSQLRRKLEPDPAHPRHLVTEPGMGYRFVREGR